MRRYHLRGVEDLEYALRDAMVRRRITQKRLAALCNVSQQSISAILHGKMVPTVALLRRMAEGLDVEFEIGGTSSATQGSGRESAGGVSELRDAAHADK